VPLARGPGAERERLVARDRELEPLVVAAWAKRIGAPEGRRWLGAPVSLSWQNWTRGFPLALSGPGTLIRAARPAFAGRVPLREFSIKSATDADIDEFVTWPELVLVRRLSVWTDAGRITARRLIALCECAHLSNLERLRMEHVELTDGAALAFLDSPHMARVTNVQLRSPGLRHFSEEIRQRIYERFGQWDIS
jgi:hypothetical protein